MEHHSRRQEATIHAFHAEVQMLRICRLSTRSSAFEPLHEKHVQVAEHPNMSCLPTWSMCVHNAFKTHICRVCLMHQRQQSHALQAKGAGLSPHNMLGPVGGPPGKKSTPSKLRPSYYPATFCRKADRNARTCGVPWQNSTATFDLSHAPTVPVLLSPRVSHCI